MTEPGWYDDPDDVRLARWHDGDAFTEHTTVKAEHATTPPPPSAPLRRAWPDAAPVQPSPLSPSAPVPFPIADYDTLTVPQVLPLLPQLYSDELPVVEAHERSTQNRRTILNELARLRMEGTLADRAPAPVAPEVPGAERGDGRSMDPRFYGGLSEEAGVLGKLLLQIGQAYDEAADSDSNLERRTWNKGVAEAYFTNVAHIPEMERSVGALAKMAPFNEAMSTQLLAVSGQIDEPLRTKFMGKSSGHDKLAAIFNEYGIHDALIALRDSVRRTGEGKGMRGRLMFGRRR